MSARIAVVSILVSTLAACSAADAPPGAAPPPSDGTVADRDAGGIRGGSGGGNGGGASGSSSSSSGGGSGSSGGQGGSGGGAGAPGSDDGGVGGGAADGGDGAGPPGARSKCGGPLDSTAPTAQSIVMDGPLAVTSYSTGLPSSPAYKSLTVYYPSKATGPFVVVMISPGLTEVVRYLEPWAQRFASYGYVAVFVEANDTRADSEATRATGLWAAIGSMQAENTRTGSPLAGKLSSCIVTSGHSLGGGASLSIANAHPTAVAGALAFNPYDPSTSFTAVTAPTLVITGQNDPTAPPAQHGRRQYDSLSPAIPKEYVEVAGGNHQSALFPGTIPGQYAVAWIKATVDGDVRYRPFLAKPASGTSDFGTTLP